MGNSHFVYSPVPKLSNQENSTQDLVLDSTLEGGVPARLSCQQQHGELGWGSGKETRWGRQWGPAVPETQKGVYSSLSPHHKKKIFFYFLNFVSI